MLYLVHLSTSGDIFIYYSALVVLLADLILLADSLLSLGRNP